MNSRDNKLYVIGGRSAKVDNENLYTKLRSRGVLSEGDKRLIKNLIVSHAAFPEDFHRLAKIILYDYFDCSRLGKILSTHVYGLAKFIEEHWTNERLEKWTTHPLKICGITIREIIEKGDKT